MNAALDSLHLDTIANSKDSISAQYIIANKEYARYTVYELRYNLDKALSLIYWAEAIPVEKKRLFGLLPSKILFKPHKQVAELFPYQSMHLFIADLPFDKNEEICATNSYQLLYYLKIGSFYQEFCCPFDAETCTGSDEITRFFESNFYYEKTD